MLNAGIKEKKTENDSVLHSQRIRSSLLTQGSPRNRAKQAADHRSTRRRQSNNTRKTPLYTLLLRTSTLRADVATGKRQTTTQAASMHDAALHLHLPTNVLQRENRERSASVSRATRWREG
jgi:hypothetical protein